MADTPNTKCDRCQKLGAYQWDCRDANLCDTCREELTTLVEKVVEGYFTPGTTITVELDSEVAEICEVTVVCPNVTPEVALEQLKQIN